MSSRPFRFIHASDLHLERPPEGLAEVPDHLRPLLIDAAYRAAERVFDAAMKAEADAVLLAGDVVDLTAAGPRAIVFLIEQFSRLESKGIHVYWAGGRIDAPERWPASVGLPDNVHVFPSDRVAAFVHDRDGVPIAEIQGISRGRRKDLAAADFRVQDRSLYSIAVAYGSADSAALSTQAVNYWALGGKHARRTVQTSPCVIHFPGAPQGRRPSESGPHGCTLVNIDLEGRARTGLVPTDVLRYQAEKVALGDRSTRAALERLLEERAAAVWNNGLGPDLLVDWRLAGAPGVESQLRRGKLAGQLLEKLRTDYGQKKPAVWSVSLGVDPEAELPDELRNQDSVLGEFLRTLGAYAPAEHPLNLVGYLGERQHDPTIAATLDLSDPETRTEVLRDAARLGADLLSGEETAR